MYIQYSVNDSAGTNAPKSPPKKILRVSCDKLPVLPSLPLIDTLPQPFDSIQYMWIGDEMAKGFLMSAIDQINKSLPTDDKIQYKQATTDDSKANPIVLVPGHHFIVTEQHAVVLDHVFGAEKSASETAGQGQPPATSVNAPATSVNAPATSANAPTKGAVSKKLGPLSLNAVTLEYKSDA